MSYRVNSQEELEKLNDLYMKIASKQLTFPASLKNELSLFKDLGRTKWADYVSPLIASVMADNPALIDACLEAGININSTCGYGDTSLRYSIAFSKLKSIRHLILKGAKVTYAEISEASGIGGETLQTFNAAVSDLAKAKESEEELEKLYDLICKISNKQLTSPASLKTEVSLFKDLGRTKWARCVKDGTNKATSPLTASVMADNPALIDACLEAGININSTCGYGNTDTSLWYSIVNSRLKSITHLILKGANVTDAEISQARRMGGETLQTFNAAVSDLAKAKESEEELEKLHDLYCKINNQQLTSPASLKTEVSLFKDLGRTKWANYGKDGKHYLTSLLTASVYADNPALIDACLEAGININSTGVSGYSTSLWSSIYCSKLKSIRHLILKGAKVTYAEISQAREIGGETLQTFNAAVSDLAKAKGLNDLFDKELKKVYDLICKINNQQLTSPASLKTELSLFKDLGRTKWANYGKDGNNYLISRKNHVLKKVGRGSSHYIFSN
jgi:hypothetical protein